MTRTLTRVALPGLCLIFCLLGAGCRHNNTTSAAAPLSATPVADAVPPPGVSPAGFQPYTLIPQPPPKPAVVAHRNRVLHLMRRSGRVYLADHDGRYYEAGRDRQGHIYPIYRDRVTQTTYPLYYDNDRDRLYRVVRNDDGRFYRGYVDDPGNRFYADGQDYERVTPPDDDRPVVTDSYNIYNYNTYNYGHSRTIYSGYHGPYHNDDYEYYRPYPYPPAAPAHHSSHHNNDWLWAIPVVVAAYFLLQPHHHHASPPVSHPARPTAPVTVIVQQHNPITIINNNGVQTTASPRPVYYAHPMARLAHPLAVSAAIPVGFAAHHVLAAHRALAASPRPRPSVLYRPSVPRVWRPRVAHLIAARPVVRHLQPVFHPRLARSAPRPAPVLHRPSFQPVRVEAARPVVHPYAARPAKEARPPVRRAEVRPVAPRPAPRLLAVRHEEARHAVSHPAAPPAFHPAVYPASRPRLVRHVVSHSAPAPRPIMPLRKPTRHDKPKEKA